ncbi:MAG: PAS domain S-box protein [Chloroflexi bacterium]|nr:PAS domain S-box protein [Chloroflexota bacterium]
MQDEHRTKRQLIAELNELRRQVRRMAEAEAEGDVDAGEDDLPDAVLRSLFQDAPLAYQSLDETGNILSVNRAWLELLGYAKDEAIGRSFGDFVAPEQVDLFHERFARFKMMDDVRGVEYDVVRSDGLRIAVVIDGRIARDADGRFLRTHCILQDITERRRMEDALIESEEMLRQVVDSLPVTLFMKDGEGHYTLINRASAIYYGVDLRHNLGKTDADLAAEGLITPERALARQAIDREVLRSGEAHHSPAYPWTTADGKARWFSTTRIPLRVPGRPDRILGVSVDITELRDAQEQLARQERLAAIGQLAGGIAHDFNNILTAILLTADTLVRAGSLSPLARRGIDTIAEESRGAAALVQQVLDFGRRTMIEVRPVALGSLIRRTGELWRRALPTQIDLEITATPPECEVMGDAPRIQQALMNLVVNARDAMPDGGRLSIRLSPLVLQSDDEPPVPGMEAGEWAGVTVADTGEGMAPEVVAHLFEPFFTTKPVGAGTGLGLAQVYGIVQQHHGYIDCETGVGHGTIFRIYLPAKIVESSIDTTPARATDPEARLAQRTLLVVEDEEAIRAVLEDILSSQGFRVLAARDGLDALARYRKDGPVDLVVTDLMMPVMGGSTLMRELRRLDPRLKGIALTGYWVEDDIDSLRADGLVEVLRKPFDFDTLCATIERLLDESSKPGTT